MPALAGELEDDMRTCSASWLTGVLAQLQCSALCRVLVADSISADKKFSTVRLRLGTLAMIRFVVGFPQVGLG